MTFDSEALNDSRLRKSRHALTWGNRVGFCWPSGRGTTPAAAMISTFFFLLMCCLISLGRAILTSQLPFLPLPHFTLPMSPFHHAACLLCFQARLVSGVRDRVYTPQSCGYWVDPSSSCGGILPWARLCIGTGYGGGPVVDVF